MLHYNIKNLGNDVAVVPGQVGLKGSSDPHKELPSPLRCWVLPASVVWTCECRVDLRMSCGLASVVWTCECRVDLRVSCGLASVVWTCEWQNNILAWVRRVKVVSHQNTSLWVFRPLHLLVVNPKLIILFETRLCLLQTDWRKSSLYWKLIKDMQQLGGRDEPEYPNSGLALRRLFLCSLTHLME